MSGVERNVTICPVNFPVGFRFCCKTCEKTLGSGLFAIGILDGGRKFFVCEDDPVECCGEEHYVPRLYADEGVMEAARQEVIHQAKRHRDLDGYIFREFRSEECLSIQ